VGLIGEQRKGGAVLVYAVVPRQYEVASDTNRKEPDRSRGVLDIQGLGIRGHLLLLEGTVGKHCAYGSSRGNASSGDNGKARNRNGSSG